mmetsp:Transcript_12976/g.26558  ORF Transcript_12976/g.26558 Transcript_12976/m.26558 type:complete len:289 (-) Transcript_12976:167-1033(-)
MNRPSQQFSRRSDFALLNIDLTEEPDSFTDEHLHEHFRNIEIDLEIDDFDHFDILDAGDEEQEEGSIQPGHTHAHVPSWGNNHRHGRCRRRESSLVSEVTTDSFLSSTEVGSRRSSQSPGKLLAEILGHGDGIASSSSIRRDDDVRFPFAGRDSVSLAHGRGVPTLPCRRRENAHDNDVLLPLLNRDSVSLAGLRGVPKSRSFSHCDHGEDDVSFLSGSVCSVTVRVDTARDATSRLRGDQEEKVPDDDDEEEEEELLLLGRDSLSIAHARRVRDRGDDLLVSWPTTS